MSLCVPSLPPRTSPRSPTISWDPKVDHPPTPSSQKRRRNTSVSVPSRDTFSPIFTEETSGRLCAQYILTTLGPLLKDSNPDFPPLDQFITQLIHRTYLPFLVIPATLVLVNRLHKCYSNSKKKCIFDPHRAFMGLFIAAAKVQCKSVSNVHNLQYWSAVSAFPLSDIRSIASTYPVLAGRDDIIGALEIDHMMDKLFRMSFSEDYSPSPRRAVGKKLASLFTRSRNSMKHSAC